eukprot:8714618-Pyramimonas_sp.AAC.1
MHPGASRRFPEEHALEIALHDGYLPTEGNAGKVLPVVLVPSVAVDLGVKERWQARGLAVGL